ncbi:hypothetical protein E6W39_02715 [Kitasatospora acidiphila]|uniref:Trypsin-co-occurring domain-containing protein n=1 Tax=Kitasatospora acidiphila TaxID=2567942 RepID=A0A540VX98_9ACTN|nr:hypothetical protein E6W39_02715 [Kitasatospora acidiphila]
MPFEDGGTFLVELPEDEASGVVRATRGGELLESASETFEAGLARVRQMAAALLERLADLPRSPDRIRVEFGIQLTGEAGMVVTKVGGEAHMILEMEWTPGEGGE